MADQPLKGRIALVTGASRGIGRAVARELSRRGAHVVATARTVGGLEDLDDEIRALGGTATLLPLDLRNGDQIDKLGPTIYQRWGHLDILVGNAGLLGPLSPLPHVTADAWDTVMRVNLEANWRLIRTLDPLLQRAEGARVVFVSAAAAHGAHAYWGPYAVSKAGLEALARTYADEVARTNVRVNVIDPGATRTAMRTKAFPGEEPATVPPPEGVAAVIADMVGPGETRNGQLVRFSPEPEGRSSASQ
jgi:NAD(P)-dependent dehydrogenase (short-subunit alcohol dehydrogenase family)